MAETITQAVKEKYGSVATSGLSSDHEGTRENRHCGPRSVPLE